MPTYSKSALKPFQPIIADTGSDVLTSSEMAALRSWYKPRVFPKDVTGLSDEAHDSLWLMLTSQERADLFDYHHERGGFVTHYGLKLRRKPFSEWFNKVTDDRLHLWQAEQRELIDTAFAWNRKLWQIHQTWDAHGLRAFLPFNPYSYSGRGQRAPWALAERMLWPIAHDMFQQMTQALQQRLDGTYAERRAQFVANKLAEGMSAQDAHMAFVSTQSEAEHLVQTILEKQSFEKVGQAAWDDIKRAGAPVLEAFKAHGPEVADLSAWYVFEQFKDSVHDRTPFEYRYVWTRMLEAARECKQIKELSASISDAARTDPVIVKYTNFVAEMVYEHWLKETSKQLKGMIGQSAPSWRELMREFTSPALRGDNALTQVKWLAENVDEYGTRATNCCLGHAGSVWIYQNVLLRALEIGGVPNVGAYQRLVVFDPARESEVRSLLEEQIAATDTSTLTYNDDSLAWGLCQFGFSDNRHPNIRRERDQYEPELLHELIEMMQVNAPQHIPADVAAYKAAAKDLKALATLPVVVRELALDAQERVQLAHAAINERLSSGS